MTVWINEFHYDNSGTDIGEFIELAGPAGESLTGWTLVLYNGSNGSAYNTVDLSDFVLPDLGSGFGAIVIDFPTNGIQNGSPDGLALVDGDGTVMEFISYEGIFVAADGPAAGMTSADIGVFETSGTAAGTSLQLSGSGTQPADFSWTFGQSATPGAANVDQTLDDDTSLPAAGTTTTTMLYGTEGYEATQILTI